MNNYQTALLRLLEAFPDNYATDQMNMLWLSKWREYHISTVHRSVDRAIREFTQFPALDEFMELVMYESTRQNKAALRERMEHCKSCDHGYIETRSDFFRPCEDCLPDAYHRWAAGDYEPTKL